MRFGRDERYILQDRIPVLERDLEKWDLWSDTADRKVCKSEIGNVEISTVFIGINADTLFETYVFGGPLGGELIRHQTWEEAEKGHKELVARVRKALGDRKKQT